MSTTPHILLTRRDAIARLGLAAAGLATAGCTPLALVLRPTPLHDPRDRGVIEPTLRMLVEAVVPGVKVGHPGAAILLLDPAYGLAPYRGELVADLQERAGRLARAPFDALPRHARQAVVREGLETPGATGRLYAGAVFLAQVTVYSGLLHPDGACPQIGFPGRGGLLPMAGQTYPEARAFLGVALTADGNPN